MQLLSPSSSLVGWGGEIEEKRQKLVGWDENRMAKGVKQKWFNRMAKGEETNNQ